MQKGPLLCLSLLWLAPASMASASPCQDMTPEIRHMEPATLRLHGDAGAQPLEVRIADSRDERAAGFQHLCPEAFGETAILFVFPQDTQAQFHMHNVHAPLDIAFIGEDGTVVDTKRMRPYILGAVGNPLYGSERPFRYALETAAGRMAQLGLGAGSRVTLP